MSVVVPQAPTRTAARVERVLLAMSALAGGVGVLKGLGTQVVPGSELYWTFTYGHGFIKRALIGTLFRPLLTAWSLEQLKPVIIAAHVGACMAVIGACGMLFRRAVDREERFDVRFTLALAYLLLMCGELLPSLAHDVGYVDVYAVLVVLAGFWLVLTERYLAAGFVAMLGPLIHESFIFLWSSVALLLVWSCIVSKDHVWKKLLAAGLPALAALGVAAFHNVAAERLMIDAMPVSQTIKDGLMAYTIGQTLQSSFMHMMQYDFRDDFGNFLTSTRYFLVPSVLIVWAAIFCYWRRWTAPWTTALVAIVAMLLPLAILTLAWDLSRFLIWSNLAAAMALIALGTPTLVPLELRP